MNEEIDKDGRPTSGCEGPEATGADNGPQGAGMEADGGAPPDAEAEEAAAEPTPDPVAALEVELAQVKSEAEGFRDSWYRAAADLENFRRRSARELEEGIARARAEVLLQVVQVLDDVDRALNAAGVNAQPAAGDEPPGTPGAKSVEEDPIAVGLKLIRGRIVEILRRHAVAEIPAGGERFDPHVHEAVMEMPSDAAPPGHVAQVLERGYLIGERLLRPARVIVAAERT